ncbi:MAG: moaA protein [Bifidobacterium breve]|nr:moaA protein [Bifidobacterium breve]
MAKRKHTGTVVIAILVAILLAVGVSGWLFWQSAQRVIGEAQQQALEQMDSAGSHIVAARDETQGMLWQAAEYVLYYGSDVKAVRGMLDAAADAATNALPKIDSAAQGTLVDFNIEELLSGMNFSDGTLSIPKIASIKQDLSDAGAVLKRVKTSIYALPQPRTEQITEMVNQGKQVVDQIDETFDTLNTIVEKIPG